MKNYGLLIIKIIVAILIFVILVELLIRLFFINYLPVEVRNVLCIEPDNELLWKPHNGLDIWLANPDGEMHNIKTYLYEDSISFRDPNKKDSYYILAIGDSFTFGEENNFTDVWTEVLERKLGKDVFNMGVSGYSTLQEELIVNKYASKLNSQIVILEFYTNDYPGSYDFPNINKADYVNRLYLSNILSLKTVNLYLTNRVQELHKFNYEVASNDFQLMYNPQELGGGYFSDMNSSIFKQGEKLVQEAMLRMRLKFPNARFVVLLIPQKEWIYRDMFIKISPNLNPFPDDIIINSMVKFLSQNNIEFIDIRKDFSKANDTGSHPFTRMGTHLSKEGNQMVANAIYKYLNG